MITIEEARNILEAQGFRPGIDSTRDHPDAADIKMALAALSAADVSPPAIAAPAVVVSKGRPRTVADMAPSKKKKK